MIDKTDFVEQAELLDPHEFLSTVAAHPNEKEIIQKLLGQGAKLVIGPRGCGKSTLMLKAYYSALQDNDSLVLPIYVNFKHSLCLEPLYRQDPKATFIFKQWLVLNTLKGLNDSLQRKKINYNINNIDFAQLDHVVGLLQTKYT